MILPTIKRLDKNDKGRDFIIGDIHGQFRMVQACLKYVKFDYSRDRLFSVGDLVDGGHQNEECLELLHQPWFYAVIGNHDAAFINYLEAYQNYRTSRAKKGTVEAEEIHEELLRAWYYWEHIGGTWLGRFPTEPTISTLTCATVNKWLIAYARCSFIVSVADQFNVIHGELVEAGKIKTDEWIATANGSLSTYGVYNLNEARLVYGLLWGRSLVNSSNRQTNNPQLKTTYCGHTPVESVTQVESHWFLDTGGVSVDKGKKYRMTIKEHNGPIAELTKPAALTLQPRTEGATFPIYHD